MVTGILLSFLSGILTIFFGAVFRFAGVKYDFKQTMLLYNILSAVFVGIFSLIYFESWASFCIAGAVLSMISGAINISGLMLLRKAMDIGNSGVAWAFCQASLLGPFLFGILCYKERPSILQYSGIGAILIALIILGSSNSGDSQESTHRVKYLILSVSSFLFGCVNGSVILTVSKIAPEFSLSVRTLFMLLGAIIILGVICLFSPQKIIINKGMVVSSLGLSLFGIFSTISMLWGNNELAAVKLGGLAIPIIQGSAIGGFALYSKFFLQEATSLMKWFGILLIILGIILMM